MLALLPIPVVIESCMPTVWQISVDWKYARKAIQTMQCKLNNVRNAKACVFTTRRGHTIWLWVQGEAGVIKCTWPYPSSSLLIWSQKLIIYSQSSCRFEGLVALSETKKYKISWTYNSDSFFGSPKSKDSHWRLQICLLPRIQSALQHRAPSVPRPPYEQLVVQNIQLNVNSLLLNRKTLYWSCLCLSFSDCVKLRLKPKGVSGSKRISALWRPSLIQNTHIFLGIPTITTGNE